jgi:hypothetical protein
MMQGNRTEELKQMVLHNTGTSQHTTLMFPEQALPNILTNINI